MAFSSLAATSSVNGPSSSAISPNSSGVVARSSTESFAPLALVRERIDAVDARATARYSASERATWYIQSAESSAVLAAVAAGTWTPAQAEALAPFLLGIEGGDPVRVYGRAVAVRDRAAGLAALGARAIAIREAAEEAVAAASTTGEVDAAAALAADALGDLIDALAP